LLSFAAFAAWHERPVLAGWGAEDMSLIEMILPAGGAEATASVGQLKLWNLVVGLDVKAGDVEQAFLGDASLPGFIVVSDDRVFGILSRRTMLNAISQPFGREVFIKRPIREMAQKMDTAPLVLAADTPIPTALRLSMARNDELRFEPCLVSVDGEVAMLEMHTLMIAQANQLEETLVTRDRLLAKIKSIVANKL
jgi:CBS domain-containing protein